MKAPKIALALFVALLAIWLIIGALKSKNEERDLFSWIKISVVQIDNAVPPGLLIEVRNDGPKVVGTTHFRLVFYADNEIFCRVDEDYGNFRPNEKRRILLKAKDLSKDAHFSSGTRISYTFQAFPEYKKGLDIVKGEFLLK